MARARPRFFRQAESVSLTGPCAAFTIWFSIVFVSVAFLGCLPIVILGLS